MSNGSISPAAMSAPSQAVLPEKPRLVLRAAFAGTKDVSGSERDALRETLRGIFQLMGHRLAAIAPGVPVEAGREPRISGWYACECPLLRLVTGLCEGADAVAAEALDEVRVPPDSGGTTPCLHTELAAVLPFDTVSYRSSRPAEFRAEFDRLVQRCAYVVELDGIYEKPNPDTPSAKTRRARGYRGQSAVLLRHADLLVAAVDPSMAGRVGGTLETARAALAFDLPVVFVHIGTGKIQVICPGSDLDAVISLPPTEDWKTLLGRQVTQIVADPGAAPEPPAVGQDDTAGHGEDFLRVFFEDATMPPMRIGEDGKPARQPGLRERIWTWFEEKFRSDPKPRSDEPLAPYADYRKRATALNYHYIGQYRGAFLLNYALAVAAVFLAALNPVITVVWGLTPDRALPALAGLGATELIIVSFILWNTVQANRLRWNDLAVDCRYLAERLRAMFYLPLASSFQPPSAGVPRYATRAVRQSAVDWLFDSIKRAISPACFGTNETVVIENGMIELKIRLLRVRPAELLDQVCKRWIAQQAGYHTGNARMMEKLHRAAEKVGAGLSVAVIVFVGADVIILCAILFHLIPHEHWMHACGPWLVFLATVLPAAVASLSGLRFQSECRRLAERSAVMRMVLSGRDAQAPSGGRTQDAKKLLTLIQAAADDPATDLGAWSHDTLRLVEGVANDFVQEVAEWSVVYAKVMVEPG